MKQGLPQIRLHIAAAFRIWMQSYFRIDFIELTKSDP